MTSYLRPRDLDEADRVAGLRRHLRDAGTHLAGTNDANDLHLLPLGNGHSRYAGASIDSNRDGLEDFHAGNVHADGVNCGEAAKAMLPDLDGIDMKTLHRILDHKREKCRLAHDSRVLAAKRRNPRRATSGDADGEDGDGDGDEDDSRWDPNWVLAADADSVHIR